MKVFSDRTDVLFNFDVAPSEGPLESLVASATFEILPDIFELGCLLLNLLCGSVSHILKILNVRVHLFF